MNRNNREEKNKMKSCSFKLRILSFFTAAAIFVATSPLAMATDGEEATQEPVWVLSYAAFLAFVGALVFLTTFFSRRRETLLDHEELKKVSKIRNQRIVERQKARQYERIHSQKKR